MTQGFLGWARSRAQRLYSMNMGQASDAAQREKTKSEGPVIFASWYKYPGPFSGDDFISAYFSQRIPPGVFELLPFVPH